MAKFRISDTVTYERTWEVEADDEEAALEHAVNHGPPDDVEEEQVDNTPYEAELVND